VPETSRCDGCRRDRCRYPGSRGNLARLVHHAAHLADRGLEADEDRLADQEMADIELAHLGDRRDRPDVGVAQPMAHVAFEAEPRAQRRAPAQALELGLLRRALELAIAPGMQFD